VTLGSVAVLGRMATVLTLQIVLFPKERKTDRQTERKQKQRRRRKREKRERERREREREREREKRRE